jgi:Zn-dependent protease with chaperone function
MDFFHAQDLARRRTLTLVALFAAAVVALIALTNIVIAFGIALASAQFYDGDFGAMLVATPAENWWWISIGVVLVVGGATLFKYLSLARNGGNAVAEALGGRRLAPDSTELAERQLQNVVEEIALAAGTAVPPVYVIPDPAINAFAAGTTPDDAVIGVTDGAIQALSRDELQGVIGHEFSHILNGDMRLNLRLIAMLHGILFIGLVGYALLRGGTTRVAVRGTRRGGSNAAPVLAIGAGLLAIGFGGTFFGNLIKAAVSRQREYLADAAAVQFTRDPLGVAGALKKIGASMAGSTLTTSRAHEFSHMFFGAAVQPFMASLMATHPPLPARIRAIEPTWDGEYPPLSHGVGDRHGSAVPPPGSDAPVLGLAAAARADDATHRSLDIADEVGRLDDRGIEAARSLKSGLPPELLDAAHEGFGACALICALLLADDADVRARQLEQLRSDPHPSFPTASERLHASAKALDPAERVALVALAMPALKAMSAPQYQRLIGHSIALIRADRRIDLFEWVLHRLLVKELKPEFEPVTAPRVRYRDVNAIPAAANELISALARRCATDPEAAHGAGVAMLGISADYETTLDPNFQRLNDALGQLRDLHPLAKPRVLKACVATVTADGQAAVAQWTLLQGVAAALDCPLPPQVSVPQAA